MPLNGNMANIATRNHIGIDTRIDEALAAK
jgi:hypothetical protein